MAPDTLTPAQDAEKYGLLHLADYTTGALTGAAGVSLFYRRWLPKHTAIRGRVVIVHGLGEHGGRYLFLIERLLAAGYGCYAQDHRGFGRSGGKPGHINRFSDYLLDLRRTVQMARQDGPEQILTLYGHSMGGLIAIRYLQRFGPTVDQAIIASPAVGLPAGRVGRGLLLTLKAASRLHPSLAIDNRGGEPVSRDPAVVADFATDHLNNRLVTARWATEMLAAQAAWPQEMAAITMPILVIQGLQDRLVMPSATQRFFRQIPAAHKTLYLYPEHYHELHNDLDREQPLGDLVEWLNQRAGG